MSNTVQLSIRVLAWISLLSIVVFTVGPLNLRPSTDLPPAIERFAAFLVAGGLFTIAYPRHPFRVLGTLLAAAITLEILQLIVAGRHAELMTALNKCAGAFCGMILGRAILMNFSLRKAGRRAGSN